MRIHGRFEPILFCQLAKPDLFIQQWCLLRKGFRLFDASKPKYNDIYVYFEYYKDIKARFNRQGLD